MKSRWIRHIIFWVAYTLFEAYIEFAWISSSFAKTPMWERWLMALEAEMALLLIKIPLTYLVIYLLDEGSERKRPGWINFGLAILALAIATILHRVLIVYLILPYFYHEAASSSMLFAIQRVISSFLDLIFVTGIAVAIKQYRVSQRSREQQKGLRKDKLEAELKFLRTQTNPHFLFNTLNNIYALARKKADETPEVVMKLSKLLRFMLYESRKDSISIADELRVLDDYIELEKIRYDDRLTIRFTKEIDNESQPIAPLILLPFVENAFKHGAGETRFDSFINLSVRLVEGQLTFTIENATDNDSAAGIQENIGLSNVRRQLELMYPEHHLQIRNEKNAFHVNLTINLLRHETVSVHHS